MSNTPKSCQLRVEDKTGQYPIYPITSAENVLGLVDELAKVSNLSIDDAAVGANAWSSKNIVDKLCPSFTETGVVVTCEPLEGYPLEVVTRFLSGSVVEELSLWHGGKNLVGWEDYSGITSTNRNMSCMDGVHKSKFTGDVSTSYIITDDVRPYMKNNHLAPGTYVFSINQESTGRRYSGCYASVALERGSTVNLPAGKAVTITEPGTITNFRCGSGQPFTKGTEITFTMQIEAANTATEYEPYRGENFTVNFDDGLLSGTYNWSTGLLTPKPLVVLTPSMLTDLPWHKYEHGHYGITFEDLEDIGIYNIDPSLAPIVLGSEDWSAEYEGDNLVVHIDALGDDEDITDIACPPILVGILGNETPIAFDPADVVVLPGENFLFSSAGETTVSGKANPVKFFENLTNAIIALGGNV